MPTLLVVHHTVSPATHQLFEAVMAGTEEARRSGIEGSRDLRVATAAALAASPTDVLDADGYLLGGPANLGYMAGALKHFFDEIYYPCLNETARRPFGVWLHGNGDVDGAELGITKITTGLRWRMAQDPVKVIGTPQRSDLEACHELGAAVAASLLL